MYEENYLCFQSDFTISTYGLLILRVYIFKKMYSLLNLCFINLGRIFHAYQSTQLEIVEYYLINNFSNALNKY